MQYEGLVKRLRGEDQVRYDLTTKGEDAVFILLAFLRYGIRHHLVKSTEEADAEPKPKENTHIF
jgi:DNA-binding HxlR family transcriptional regulator